VTDKYGKSGRIYGSSDLSLPGAAKKLYDHVIKEGYKVDALVNGAGLGGAGDTFSQLIEPAERITILDCISLVQLTQLFGKDMIERECGW
jgi:short-subunit dehydrogenase